MKWSCIFGMTKISFFQKEENYIREVCRSLINNPEYYAVTRRIMTNNKRDSMAVQKEIQWLSTETRIRVEMKREEDQERCVRRQQSFWSEFIFFGKTFIHAKGFERARGIWERKNKKKRGKEDEGGKESACLTRPSHASPSHLHYIQHTRAFSSNPLSLVPSPFRRTLFSPKSWGWYIKSLRFLILVKTKISILLSKRL